MLFQFWLLLLAAAVGALLGGLKLKRWLLTMFAMVLFFVLAFGSMRVEVVSGGATLFFGDMAIVLLMAFAGFVSFLFTLHGVLEFVRKSDKEADPRRGP